MKLKHILIGSAVVVVISGVTLSAVALATAPAPAALVTVNEDIDENGTAVQVISGDLNENELYIFAQNESIPEAVIHDHPDAEIAVLSSDENKVAEKVLAFNNTSHKVALKIAQEKVIALAQADADNKILNAWNKNTNMVLSANAVSTDIVPSSKFGLSHHVENLMMQSTLTAPAVEVREFQRQEHVQRNKQPAVATRLVSNVINHKESADDQLLQSWFNKAIGVALQDNAASDISSRASKFGFEKQVQAMIIKTPKPLPIMNIRSMQQTAAIKAVPAQTQTTKPWQPQKVNFSLNHRDQPANEMLTKKFGFDRHVQGMMRQVVINIPEIDREEKQNPSSEPAVEAKQAWQAAKLNFTLNQAGRKNAAPVKPNYGFDKQVQGAVIAVGKALSPKDINQLQQVVHVAVNAPKKAAPIAAIVSPNQAPALVAQDNDWVKAWRHKYLSAALNQKVVTVNEVLQAQLSAPPPHEVIAAPHVAARVAAVVAPTKKVTKTSFVPQVKSYASMVPAMTKTAGNKPLHVRRVNPAAHQRAINSLEQQLALAPEPVKQVVIAPPASPSPSRAEPQAQRPQYADNRRAYDNDEEDLYQPRPQPRQQMRTYPRQSVRQAERAPSHPVTHKRNELDNTNIAGLDDNTVSVHEADPRSSRPNDMQEFNRLMQE